MNQSMPATRFIRSARFAAAGSIVALLVACGGGGGSSGGAAPSGSGTVTSASAFDVHSGYQARISAGASDNYTVTGSCAGTATITNGATAPATFEGVSALSASQTATVTFTNCSPSVSTASGTNYYDSSDALLGTVVLNPVSQATIEYARWSATTTPAPLPTAAKVGDAGTLTTLTTYSDSTKTTVTGQRIFSYSLEADTASTAILNLVQKTYDASNTLLITQQSRYRVAANGSLTVLTIDVQYSGSSTAHLVYTKA
jgi:hypothetical protein